MIYEICTQTDPGLVRGNNEDVVEFDAATRLCLLADGMGGYNAGEVASRMAVGFIQHELGRWLAQAGADANAREVRRAMDICVDNANRSVFNAANANPQFAGMGTTLVVAVFQADRLVIGHIGDSRCYRLRGQVLQQITNDHSLLQEQLDAGLITRQQALTATYKNLVTRALGVQDTVLLEVSEHRVDAGDVFLMCSDGLSDMVLDADIAAVLASSGTLSEKAQRLVLAANDQGGRDNISVLLALAAEDTCKKSLFARILGK
jgi:protein phosphatase